MANPPIADDLCQQAIDAAAAHGSVNAGARSLNMPTSTFRSRYINGISRGMAPGVQRIPPAAAIPEGYKLKGTSTYYDRFGAVRGQWVKTNAELEALHEMQRAALEVMCEQIPPLAPIKAPKHRDEDLATLYTITDSHVGMLAWDKETGADWDLGIAEKCLTQTLARMIDSAPESATGIVNQLGDFLHFDSLIPMTPTNKHVLDADSRYQKMVQVAVRILRNVIEYALKKHSKIHVQMKEGNHDPAGSAWLRVMFSQLYEKNPRVTVDMSPNPYTVFEHGKTLLGFYHGHLIKKANLGELFAAQFREYWGRCEYVYIHTGHLHNHEELERRGCKVIQHATLAAPDAFAARFGWISKRQAVSMTYSKQTGEVSRGVFVP